MEACPKPALKLMEQHEQFQQMFSAGYKKIR
jgi:hypothetical protein